MPAPTSTAPAATIVRGSDGAIATRPYPATAHAADANGSARDAACRHGPPPPSEARSEAAAPIAKRAVAMATSKGTVHHVRIDGTSKPVRSERRSPPHTAN